MVFSRVSFFKLSWRHGTQLEGFIFDTQLSIFETNYAECRYAESHYAECRGAIEFIKVCKRWVISKVFTSLSWLDQSPNLSSMS